MNFIFIMIKYTNHLVSIGAKLTKLLTPKITGMSFSCKEKLHCKKQQ